MGNPLANLGDYNIARDALKAAGGNWQSLYKSIGDTAVAKATPKWLLLLGIVGLGWAGREAWHLMKRRKQLVECEPSLKEKFAEMVKAESSKVNDDLSLAAEVKEEPPLANDGHTENVELSK